jgi:hypothetical protein
MIGRKGLVGLSLLCALAFCAFGAASASASGGTTAYTCDPEAQELDFEDEHCDNNVGSGGEFGHTVIPPNEETTITGTNNLTASNFSSWLLKGVIGGTNVEITCETVHAHADIENVPGPPMQVVGEGTLEAENCMLMQPSAQTANCKVTVAPTTSNAATVNGEMKMNFTPTGAHFTEITIADETGHTCSKALKGTFPVEGSAFATGKSTGTSPSWSGATLHFTTADTAGTLIFAGHAAELEGTLTFRMDPEGGPEGNPIVFTTE